MSYVEQARRAAGMTIAAAAAITGLSAPTYAKREKDPDSFTVGQLRMLGWEMDELSRGILWQHIGDEDVFFAVPFN